MQRWIYLDAERLALKDPLTIGVPDKQDRDRAFQYARLLEEYALQAIIGSPLGQKHPTKVIHSTGTNKPSSWSVESEQLKAKPYTHEKCRGLSLEHDGENVLARRIIRLYTVFDRLAEFTDIVAELPQGAALEDAFTSPDSQFSIFITQDNTYVQFERDCKNARTYKLNMRILEINCNPFIHTDPFRLELKEEIKKRFMSDITDILRSQYASLLDEYATRAILAEEPDSERSTMAGSGSGSQLIRSPNLRAMSYGDKWIGELTLEYNEEKIPLVRRLHRLYGIFNKLAAGACTQAVIPETAMMLDVFASHHTNLFLFGTEKPLGVYIRLTKDAEKVKNFKNTQSVTYQITG